VSSLIDQIARRKHLPTDRNSSDISYVSTWLDESLSYSSNLVCHTQTIFKNKWLRVQIIHRDMKENVSGCFVKWLQRLTNFLGKVPKNETALSYLFHIFRLTFVLSYLEPPRHRKMGKVTSVGWHEILDKPSSRRPAWLPRGTVHQIWNRKHRPVSSCQGWQHHHSHHNTLIKHFVLCTAAFTTDGVVFYVPANTV